MLLSIILGLIVGWALGILWFNYGHGKGGFGASIHHGPNSKDIVGNVFKFGDKYYKFSPVICPCPLLKG